MIKPGEEKLQHLFQPGKIGKFTTKNRIKYGACCVSNYNNRDGSITNRELARTKVIAETGCGIITNQGAYPDPKGEGKAYYRQVALYDERFLPQFEEIAQYIHDNEAVAIQQILHAGRYGGIDLGYCIQPSVVPQTLPHFRPPKELTKEEIKQVIKDHAYAAQLAVKAGFDGVEITSFMGYLLANFNSCFTNKRTDEYGGSLEKRALFMKELIYAIKESIGDDHPLIARLNGAELMDRYGCNTEDECLELMKIASDCGLDMISVTVGWQEAPVSSIARDIPPGHWNRLAARAKKELPHMPIAFGVRLPDPVMADACIGKGEFDFWEVCRPLLADPEMVRKAQEDRLEEYKKCIGCMLCLARLFRDLPYLCTLNPKLGHEVEPEYHIKPPAYQKRVMIVGGGPSGLECAIAAKKRGHQVSIYEESDKLGGQLTLAAQNDLAHKKDLLDLIAYYKVQIEKLDIEVNFNTPVNSKMFRKIAPDFDVVVVATGSQVPRGNWPGADKAVIAHQYLAGEAACGQKAAVIGGNKIGLLTAELLATKGCQVTIIEESKGIGNDVVPTWKWRHTSWVKELKIEVITQAKIQEIQDTGVIIKTEGGEEKQVPADTVIIASPQQSRQENFTPLEFMVDELHIIGDALAPRNLHNAIHEGYKLGVRI